MIGSSGNITSKLASVYASNSEKLNDVLVKLSTGRKFQSAYEDVTGFIRSVDIGSEIELYQEIRDNLFDFKTFTSSAILAGSSVFEDLSRLKGLANQYAGSSDTDLKTSLETEFDSLKDQIGNALTYTLIDDKMIMQSASVIATVNIVPQGGMPLKLDFSDVADSSAIGEMSINDLSIEEKIDEEIKSMTVYVSEAKSFDNFINQQIKLNGIIINNKESLKSLITGIDDATEMNKLMDLTIRQDASMAMIAQGNLMQNSLSLLYESPGLNNVFLEDKSNEVNNKKAITDISIP